MVSFTLTAAIVSLASIAAAAAVPASNAVALQHLETRQAQMPSECTEYCSNSAGCVCIRRPTNCVANYLVQPDENCYTITSRFNNFTATDLYKWNPEIGSQCFGLQAFVPVCIGVTGYTYPGPVKAGDIWTAEQTPIPTMPGIVPNCTKFEYTDNTGSPALSTIFQTNGITKTQWNSWNFPTQNSTNDFFQWANFFSCVKA